MASNELRGTLKTWDDEKGYGFISPDEGYGEVFLHISAVRGGRRPSVGDPLLFIASMDRKGRQRAEHARPEGSSAFDERSIRRKLKSVDDPEPRPRRQARPERRPGSIAYLPMKIAVFVLVCLLPVLGLVMMMRMGQFIPLFAYLALSALAVFLFYDDKRRAYKKQRRTPEASLHLVELLGGWPGSLVAQQLFRHKTRKLSYQAMCWLVVLMHQYVWFDYLFLNGRIASVILGYS